MSCKMTTEMKSLVMEPIPRRWVVCIGVGGTEVREEKPDVDVQIGAVEVEVEMQAVTPGVPRWMPASRAAWTELVRVEFLVGGDIVV